MSTLQGRPGALKVPYVSQAEIETFHVQHFSSAATQLFATDFLQPRPNHDESNYHEEYSEGYDEYEEEDDGLGYYSDGVKRTLTDEQIAIFRHSELEALRREEEKKEENLSRKPLEMQDTDDGHQDDGHAPDVPAALSEVLEDAEEGEIESDTPQPNSSEIPKKKRNKKKSKKNKQPAATNPRDPHKGEHGWFKKTVKPDLRKRTWDVVETGMDSLDYDEFESTAGSRSGQAVQRRKISYDD